MGAIDSPQWRNEDPVFRFINRAGSALGGLWGNHGYEAIYPNTYVDADGVQLNGANTYELTLNPTPPNEAFWSLTMYDVPDYFLVPNAINRYSLGDRTPGITYDDDGGITIVISAQEPQDPAACANWLPAPTGDFRPVLRVYNPGAEMLDGTYTLPPIRRIS